MPGVQFGSFNTICQTAALVICPLIGTDQGIEPTCYSRNIDVGGTLIFQPCMPVSHSLEHCTEPFYAATCFVHIVAILMTAIMIYHIRSKYTAVGRKEIVLFFWMYALIELLAMLLDSGLIPTANGAYPVRTHPLSNLTYLPVNNALLVVRSSVHRPSRCRLLLYSHQWFRWLSIRRGRYTPLSLGMILPSSLPHKN